MPHSANCSHTACASEEESTFRADYRIKAGLIFQTLKRPHWAVSQGSGVPPARVFNCFAFSFTKLVSPSSPEIAGSSLNKRTFLLQSSWHFSWHLAGRAGRKPQLGTENRHTPQGPPFSSLGAKMPTEDCTSGAKPIHPSNPGDSLLLLRGKASLSSGMSFLARTQVRFIFKLTRREFRRHHSKLYGEQQTFFLMVHKLNLERKTGDKYECLKTPHF